MAEVKSLSSRIDDEFAAVEKRAKDQQAERLQEYAERTVPSPATASS